MSDHPEIRSEAALLGELNDYKATVEALDKRIKKLYEKIDRLEEEKYYLQHHWSIHSSKPCPNCTYEDGKFIRACKPCETIHFLMDKLDDSEMVLQRLTDDN